MSETVEEGIPCAAFSIGRVSRPKRAYSAANRETRNQALGLNPGSACHVGINRSRFLVHITGTNNFPRIPRVIPCI
jgi:hypothetical protein